MNGDPLDELDEAWAEVARLRLTEAERSAIRDAADRYASITPESAATAATLRGLLDRTAGRRGLKNRYAVAERSTR